MLPGDVFNDMHIFDTEALMWTNLSNIRILGTPPVARRGAACTAYGKFMFMFGGIDANGDQRLQ